MRLGRFVRSLVCAATVVVVAGGCAPDSPPGDGTSELLEIATEELPIPLVGQTYAAQLVARGGSGDLMWTLDRPDWAPAWGVTLETDGRLLLVGDRPAGQLIRVRVDDGVQQRTRLLVVGQSVGGGEVVPVPTGEQLPAGDGVRFTMVNLWDRVSGWSGVYDRSGVVVRTSATSVLDNGIGHASSVAQRVAAVAVNGDSVVVDADTGAVVHRISGAVMNASEVYHGWSPDGRYLTRSVPADPGVTLDQVVSVYDSKQNWTLIRTVTSAGHGGQVWSPRSDRVIVGGVAVSVGEGGGTGDTEVGAPDGCSVAAWSVLDRLALQCANGTSTTVMSMPVDRSSPPRTVAVDAASPQFSPEGSYLVYERFEHTTPVDRTTWLVYALDAAGAAEVRLTVPQAAVHPWPPTASYFNLPWTWVVRWF